jgi:hypothetical protein
VVKQLELVVIGHCGEAIDERWATLQKATAVTRPHFAQAPASKSSEAEDG